MQDIMQHEVGFIFLTTHILMMSSAYALATNVDMILLLYCSPFAAGNRHCFELQLQLRWKPHIVQQARSREVIE